MNSIIEELFTISLFYHCFCFSISIFEGLWTYSLCGIIFIWYFFSKEFDNNWPGYFFLLQFIINNFNEHTAPPMDIWLSLESKGKGCAIRSEAVQCIAIKCSMVLLLPARRHIYTRSFNCHENEPQLTPWLQNPELYFLIP